MSLISHYVAEVAACLYCVCARMGGTSYRCTCC